jgi:hypothetical protein
MRTVAASLKGILVIIAVLGVFSLSASREALAHGRALTRKQGEPAAVEVGPHGGAVIDIGNGHFELVRDPAGALSLYRLASDLKAIPAEDVDAAEIYVLKSGGQTVKFALTPVRSDTAPLHFSGKPPIAQRGGYLAVVSVATGEKSRNLRFQVKGI